MVQKAQATYLWKPILVSYSDTIISDPMAFPISIPKYVYKILSEAPSDPLPISLPLSALDTEDGFIHLSTAAQTPVTAGRFFSATEKLWVLKIPVQKLESNVRWEENQSGCFPHLYGAHLGQREVESTKTFTRGEDYKWTAILKEDEWLS